MPSATIDTPKTIGRKPLFSVNARSVLNLTSGFSHKKLCDGPTFSLGSACVYSCSFCYVPAIMGRNPHLKQARDSNLNHRDVVVRREGALEVLEKELKSLKPSLADSQIVCYTSPLVDPAATMSMCKETADACNLIFDNTEWDVRILTKSSMLQHLVKHIKPQHKLRVILGCSTGTFDDQLCKAFELDTPLVSKRIQSIRKLQEDGWRTYGMLCPMLPVLDGTVEDYKKEIALLLEGLNLSKLEHVWGEVINVRGESMARTNKALTGAGYSKEASAITQITQDRRRWERYSRRLFKAFRGLVPPDKLRFLQYVDSRTHEAWKTQEPFGAVLLGAAAI